MKNFISRAHTLSSCAIVRPCWSIKFRLISWFWAKIYASLLQIFKISEIFFMVKCWVKCWFPHQLTKFVFIQNQLTKCRLFLQLIFKKHENFTRDWKNYLFHERLPTFLLFLKLIFQISDFLCPNSRIIIYYSPNWWNMLFFFLSWGEVITKIQENFTADQ